MDPFTIGLIAALSGAAINYKSSQDAQRRQREEISRSLETQKKFHTQAEQKAMDTADDFAAPNRVANQDQIAQEVEKSLINPVSESQAIRSQQQAVTGDVSGDYQSAKAASDLETTKQAQKLAQLLGKTTSAGRLRTNESLKMMDAGQEIDRLSNFSHGAARADDIAIKAAGQIDPKMAFMGSLLQTAGAAGMMYGGLGGVDKLAVGAEPVMAASPGMAPVYDVGRVGAIGGGGLWAPGAMYGWKNFAKAFQK